MAHPAELAQYQCPQLLDTTRGGLIAQGDYTEKLSALVDILTARSDLCAAVERLELSTQEYKHPTWIKNEGFPKIEVGPARELLSKTVVESLKLIDLHGENAPQWVEMVARAAPTLKELDLDANNEHAYTEHVQFNTIAGSLANLAELEHLTLQSVYFDDEDDFGIEVPFPEGAKPSFKLQSLVLGDSGEAWPVPIKKLAWLSGASEGSPSSLARLSISLCDIPLVEWIKTNLPALTHCTLPLLGEDRLEVADEYFTKLLELTKLPGLVELKLVYADGVIDDEELSVYKERTDALNGELGREVVVFELESD